MNQRFARRIRLADFLLKLFSILYSLIFVALNLLTFYSGIYTFLIYTVPTLLGGVYLMLSVLPTRNRKLRPLEIRSSTISSSLNRMQDQAGFQGVHKVQLILEPQAFAYYQGGEHLICLGFPYVKAYSKAELDFILAHELAHHIFGDTKGNPAFSLEDHLKKLHTVLSRRFSGAILLPFKPIFIRVVKFVRKATRESELQADEFAAKSVGKGPSLSSLKNLGNAEVTWFRFWNTWLRVSVESGVRLDISEFYEVFLAVNKTEESSDSEPRRRSGEFDTHPSIQERTDSIEKMLLEEGDCGQDRHLLENTDELNRYFYRSFGAVDAVTFLGFEEGYRRTQSDLLARYRTALAPYDWNTVRSILFNFERFSYESFQITKQEDYEYEKYMFAFLISAVLFARNPCELRIGSTFTPLVSIGNELVELGSVILDLFGQSVDDRFDKLLVQFSLDPTKPVLEDVPAG